MHENNIAKRKKLIYFPVFITEDGVTHDENKMLICAGMALLQELNRKVEKAGEGSSRRKAASPSIRLHGSPIFMHRQFCSEPLDIDVF